MNQIAEAKEFEIDPKTREDAQQEQESKKSSKASQPWKFPRRKD